jgi:hypothetical protein
MRCVLANAGIKITRPERRTDLRISDFDESVTAEEVVSAIVGHTGCAAEAVRCGIMRRMRNGLFMIWVQGPSAEMLQVAELGTIWLGWSKARVDLLRKRPLYCYWCLARGHTT